MKGQEDEIWKKFLKTTTNDKFVKAKSHFDEQGMEHIVYQQYYKDVKVEYATYRVHIKKRKIESVNGDFLKIKDLDISPKVCETEALENALKKVAAKSYAWEFPGMEELIKKQKEDENATYYPEAELVIWNSYEKDKISLAYKFDIYSLEPANREFVFIDAHTGKVIDREQIMKNSSLGTAHTRYSDTRAFQAHYSVAPTGYYLLDNSRGASIYTMDMNNGTNLSQAENYFDNDNNWTSAEWHNTYMDDGALDAHWGLQMVYDYWKTQHNRNSYDGSNGWIYCYVHYYFGNPNAAWSGDGIIKIGDDIQNSDVLSTLDIVAHEFGHGICEYTCNLRYQRESGALNEGLSDIWGACVEEYAAPEKQEWRIGEEITLGPIRAMDNPNLFYDPDTYAGTYWINPNCGTPTEYNDFCGVHTNSGVLNYWFYLLSEGGNDINDNDDCFFVEGIGMTIAAKITYKMERDYLGRDSDFDDARTYTIQAARNLYGTGSNEEVQVTNAWYAVGVGGQYTMLITGPSVVCTSNTTFTLHNRPPGETVSWIRSKNLIYVSGQGTDNYTVRAYSNEDKSSAFVKATVTGTCGQTVLQKTTWVGRPGLPVSTPDGDPPMEVTYGSSFLVNLFHPPGADPSTGAWSSLGSISITTGGSGSSCGFEAVGIDYGQWHVTTSNSCGVSDTYIGQVIVPGWKFSMQPNPANDYVEIIAEKKEYYTKGMVSDTYEVKIFNILKSPVYVSTKTDQPILRIDTKQFVNGTYFIHFTAGKQSVVKQLVISH